MTRQRAHHVRSRAGYSLIELLVAIAIFGVLAAAGLPHVDTRRQDVQTATKQLMADVRWARTRAITTGVHWAINIPDTSHYQLQRMKQLADGTWAADGQPAKQVAMPTTVQLYSFPTFFEFNTRGMMVSASYAAYPMLYDTQYEGWRMVSIWPSGQVYEEI